MEELFTYGRAFYEGRKVPLWYNADEIFSKELGINSRFRLVLVEAGAGILRVGELRMIFSAPTLFCLNEKDIPYIEKESNLKARAIYFHPRTVNSALDFENIRGSKEGLKETERNDIHWLRPFIKRDEKYNGQLSIGPATAQRISQLFESVSAEFNDQRDRFWPCRGRSFFLELLFTVERIFSSPEQVDKVVLTETPNDIDQVILYLHTNFQKKITLVELSKTFHINRTTLTERFYKATGMSVMAYLIKLRVDMAAAILRDTALPITEIMERVGFNDSAHFGRMFRKHTGYSPTQYREQFCWIAG